MTAAVPVRLLSLWQLLSLLTAVLSQFVSPFFYLCSFQQSNVDQTNTDVGQVALSVTIDGDPQFYVPGQLYNGNSVFLIVLKAFKDHQYICLHKRWSLYSFNVEWCIVAVRSRLHFISWITRNPVWLLTVSYYWKVFFYDTLKCTALKTITACRTGLRLHVKHKKIRLSFWPPAVYDFGHVCLCVCLSVYMYVYVCVCLCMCMSDDKFRKP